MAMPVFFVKKKDGKLCLVQDYYALNAMTMKNKYPLPLIPELIVKLQGVKYFTKLNIRWRFNNVHIKEVDKCEFEKTMIEYLRVIISHNSVAMDPVKIAGIRDWPAPMNKKEVQSFLGFTNFY